MLKDEFRQADEMAGVKADESYFGLLSSSVLSAEDLRNLDIPERKKYLGPISEGTIGQIFGPRGVGKTQLRDAIALSLTRGVDLGPWISGSPAGVLILDGEMSVFDLKTRQALDCNVGPAVKPLGTISSQYLFETTRKTINLLDAEWRDAVLKLLEENPQFDVVIFDNLSSFLPGSKENDSEAWGAINQFFLQIRWMKRAAVFLHHAGKSGDQRGTSAREDQLDWVLRLDDLAGGNPENGCKFQTTLTKNRSLIGPEATSFVFSLDGDPPKWTIVSKYQSQREIIVALLGKGVSQKEVCELTKFDKGLVSRTRKKAILDDELTSSGDALTVKGLYEYGNIIVDDFLKS
jgi:putative DNA primase/helicase